ncbi:MAG: hypothetical protein FIB06_08080 [Betaproteobacteria bacterium]|nr:hypothetical protein [Betaproteobacteria bacterium]
MGIGDWFRNRTARFDDDSVPAETLRWAADKAVTLTDPKLRMVSGWEKRLMPSIANAIQFMRGLVHDFPAMRPLSAKVWAGDPALRAFFVTPKDIDNLLARSDQLRAVFEKSPGLGQAALVLGMSIAEQKTFGLAVRGDTIQRDVAQNVVSFSDHKTRLCAADESALRRVIGIEIFEYLVSRALAEIGAERTERHELQGNRALIRARLQLLQQHGPGLGAMLGDGPAAPSEQARLEAELLDNERQLAAMGGIEEQLAGELDALQSVFDRPQDYLAVAPKRVRLNTMNVVVGESEAGTDIDFAVIDLKGPAPVRRAFVIACVERSDLPPPKTLDYYEAMRYL